MFNKIKNIVKYYKTKRYLKKLDPSKIKSFSFNGVQKYARIVKVYDGDTCTIIFRWKKQNIKCSCRLYGIDTPEIRTTNKKEKELGYIAKDFLSSLLLEKVVMVHFLKDDKYGRPLVNIFLNGSSIQEIMITNGFAKPYFGGKKYKW
jgi:micrococcal nuclease